MAEAVKCGCGRPLYQCVKGDLAHCPALDDDDSAHAETMTCPGCGGSGTLDDVIECEECWGTGSVTL